MEELKKKLQEQITALETELRIELPREIAKARAHGDLSENAEYHAAKDRQGFVNARLNQLKKRLAEMSMIDFSKIPHGKVGLGSTVVVLDAKRDEEITYNLVTTEEADAANDILHPSQDRPDSACVSWSADLRPARTRPQTHLAECALARTRAARRI